MVRERHEEICPMKKLLMQFVNDTEGQDLIEYALLAATISIAVVAAMRLVANALNSEFTTISSSITSGS
jgi:pilus assembly protein Flp/PilA